MEAKDIYHILKSIVEPIWAHDDQLVAIAKWIEAEWEYKGQKINKYRFIKGSEYIGVDPSLTTPALGENHNIITIHPPGKGLSETCTEFVEWMFDFKGFIQGEDSKPENLSWVDPRGSRREFTTKEVYDMWQEYKLKYNQ